MVGLSQYSQLPVPVLLYTLCHILPVNTACQTLFQEKEYDIKNMNLSSIKILCPALF